MSGKLWKVLLLPCLCGIGILALPLCNPTYSTYGDALYHFYVSELHSIIQLQNLLLGVAAGSFLIGFFGASVKSLGLMVLLSFAWEFRNGWPQLRVRDKVLDFALLLSGYFLLLGVETFVKTNGSAIRNEAS